MKPFLREPAWWVAGVAITVELLVAWKVPLGEAAQSQINAAATAIAGFILAASVAREKALPLVAGLVTALMQLAASFGLHADQNEIAMTGAFLTFVFATYVRKNATAPVTEDGQKVEPSPLVGSSRL